MRKGITVQLDNFVTSILHIDIISKLHRNYHIKCIFIKYFIVNYIVDIKEVIVKG